MRRSGGEIRSETLRPARCWRPSGRIARRPHLPFQQSAQSHAEGGNRYVEPERAKLSVDPALRRRFKEDPAALEAEAGLSLEDLELVAGGRPEQIRDALGGDATVNCFMLFADKDEE